MPRYYFHVADGKDFPDLQGTELADLAAARREALRFSGAMLSDASERFWSGDDWAMTVTDERGLTLFVLNFMATDAPAVSAGS